MAYFDFIKNHLPRLSKARGCTEEEIIQLEQKHQLQLPAAYKEYLRLFGKNTGGLLEGFYTTIDEVKQNAATIEFDMVNTDHSHQFKITPGMFFFGQWQGTVLYFICDGNENPPVYMVESLDDIVPYTKTFTDFVRAEGL